MNAIIKVLEKYVKKHGDQPLTTAQLLNMLTLAETQQQQEKKKILEEMDGECGWEEDQNKEGKGFEITYFALGSFKQICGGGEYENGIGFAIGVDRLLQNFH